MKQDLPGTWVSNRQNEKFGFHVATSLEQSMSGTKDAV